MFVFLIGVYNFVVRDCFFRLVNSILFDHLEEFGLANSLGSALLSVVS